MHECTFKSTRHLRCTRGVTDDGQENKDVAPGCEGRGFESAHGRSTSPPGAPLLKNDVYCYFIDKKEAGDKKDKRKARSPVELNVSTIPYEIDRQGWDCAKLSGTKSVVIPCFILLLTLATSLTICRFRLGNENICPTFLL